MGVLFKNTARTVINLGTNKLLYLLLTVLMAKKLGVTGVGKYGFIVALTGLFFMISGIGAGVAVRELAGDKKNIQKYVWNIFLLRGIMSLIAFLIVIVISHFYVFDSETKKSIYILSTALFFYIFSGTAISIFQALQQFKLLMITGIIGDFIAVGSAILFLLSGKGITGIFFGLAFGGLAYAIMSTGILFRKGLIGLSSFETDFTWLKRFLEKGLYFFLPSLILVGIFQTGIIVITYLGNITLTGFYQSAYKLSFGSDIISLAFTYVMYPVYALQFKQHPKDLKEKYIRGLFCSLFIAMVICVLLIVSANTLIHYVYGSGFEPAIGLTRILAIAVAINALNRNNFTFLNAVRKEKLNSYIIMLIFIMNFVLDIVLFRQYGVKGIAMATVLCTLGYFVISTMLILKETKSLEKTQGIKYEDLIAETSVT